MSKEFKRRVSGNEETSGSGLFVVWGRTLERDGRNKRKSHSKSRVSSKIKCYNCKEKCHIRRDCPQLKKMSLKNVSINNVSATIVEDTSSEEDIGDVLIICTSSYDGAWVVDICAYII